MTLPLPTRTRDEARRGPAPVRVSVIVNTNGRRESLAELLRALAFQRHGAFEVVVVCGPARDGTREAVADEARAGRVKMTICEEANLALSRNLGLSQAAGELVAFIDDDAIPEPTWLEELVDALADPEVAGAGGRVYGPDGRTLQFRHSLCDRFGDVTADLAAPHDEASFPFSAAFPHLMGTNCLFRRDAVAAIGGFDEFYSYFLEETDLCLRLMDAGGRIRQTGGAPVHHRFLPGTVRGEGARALPILRSRIYFPLVNAHGHAAMEEILRRSLAFVEERRERVGRAVATGATHPLAEEEFDADAQAAWREGLAAGLAGRRRVRPPADFEDPPAFLPFPAQGCAGPARHIVLLAERRPAAVPVEAAAWAKGGHLARLLHPADRRDHGADREGSGDVGFAQGVFVHAVPVLHASPAPLDIAPEEAAAWAGSAALLAEIERLDAVRPVDAVAALDGPLGAALRRTGRFPVFDTLAEAGRAT